MSRANAALTTTPSLCSSPVSITSNRLSTRSASLNWNKRRPSSHQAPLVTLSQIVSRKDYNSAGTRTGSIGQSRLTGNNLAKLEANAESIYKMEGGNSGLNHLKNSFYNIVDSYKDRIPTRRTENFSLTDMQILIQKQEQQL